MVNAIFYSSVFSTSAVISPAILSTSMALKEFFTHLFLYPEKHTIAIMAMGVVAIAIPVGVVFLIKMLFEKCFPK